RRRDHGNPVVPAPTSMIMFTFYCCSRFGARFVRFGREETVRSGDVGWLWADRAFSDLVRPPPSDQLPMIIGSARPTPTTAVAPGPDVAAGTATSRCVCHGCDSDDDLLGGVVGSGVRCTGAATMTFGEEAAGAGSGLFRDSADDADLFGQRTRIRAVRPPVR